MTDFSTTILSTGPTAVVLVAGELDLATAPELEAALAGALGDHHVVEVDLQDATFMACAGINVLIAARVRAAANGSTLTVVRSSAAVDRVLRLARVGWLLSPARSTTRRPSDGRCEIVC